MSGLRVRLATDPLKLAPAWADLASRLGAAPFLYPGWVVAWYAAFGRGRLVVATGERPDGSLAAVLPLQARGRSLFSPTNWHTPEFGPLIDDPSLIGPLLATLFAHRPRRLQLGWIDPHMAGLVREHARRHGYRSLIRVLERAPYVPVDGSFAAYRANLGRHMRSELTRRSRRLSEQGMVELDVQNAFDSEALEEFFRVESAGWKGRSGTDIAARMGTKRFYTAMARWAATQGWLRLVALRLDGQIVAGDLALEAGGVHYLVKTGLDPAYRRFAAGKLLRQAMLDRTFSAGMRSYEFLGADEPWKLEWTTLTRPRLLVQAFAPTPGGELQRLAYARGRPAAKRALAAVRHVRQ